MLAVFTASDTIATVLSNVFWNILRFPRYYEQLQAEVDKYYPAGADAFDTAHHGEMVWLDAITNEALRLYPIVPSGSQRAPAPGDGARVVGPYVIPAGTSARVHTWSLQCDPRCFSRPDAFWPERWLAAAGLGDSEATCEGPEGAAGAAEDFVHDARAFEPYFVGPLDCIGRALAQLELRMVLCALLQRLAFAPARG